MRDSPNKLQRDAAASNEPEIELARLALIIESSEDAIISKDLTGIIQSWNASAERIYGHSLKEAIGQNIRFLIPAGREDEELEILHRIGRGERVEHFETVRLRKGGSPIHVSLTISPIRDRTGRVVGASHVAREIGDRRLLEAANARLAAIVESSEDAIISKDLSGVVQTWNVGAERLYGYSVDEAVGRNIGFLLPPSRGNEEQEILAKLRRGERVEHFETSRLRKGGTLIEVSLSISPICDASGVIVGASHVARDITERKRFEQQMRQTQRLESLGVLAGGIAHDFNNLLTGIIGNASLVSDTLPEANASTGYLNDLMAAAQRAADLTRQLLAYSGRGQFVIGKVSLSQLVAEISTLVQASIPKSVTVRLDLEKDIPLIDADQSQIQQLVMNMIINGAEAIGENNIGTVLVKTGGHHLDENYIQAALPGSRIAPGEYVYIEVRDNGCGMDDDTKARIFDPFFTTKFTGRGLGLAAALGIVNAHNGAVRVTSRPNEGSTFRVFLPTSGGMPTPHRVTPEPTKGTILLADDEEMVRKVGKSALENHGYRVLLAANGREAVEQFHEMASSITLIILDLTMPLMSGEDALQRLRAIRADVPIILSSGYGEADTMRRFAKQDLSGFLQKPYTSAQLKQKVDSVVHPQ